MKNGKKLFASVASLVIAGFVGGCTSNSHGTSSEKGASACDGSHSDKKCCGEKDKQGGKCGGGEKKCSCDKGCCGRKE